MSQSNTTLQGIKQKEIVDGLEDIDISELECKLESIEDNNRQARDWKRYTETESKYGEAKTNTTTMISNACIIAFTVDFEFISCYVFKIITLFSFICNVNVKYHWREETEYDVYSVIHAYFLISSIKTAIMFEETKYKNSPYTSIEGI